MINRNIDTASRTCNCNRSLEWKLLTSKTLKFFSIHFLCQIKWGSCFTLNGDRSSLIRLSVHMRQVDKISCTRKCYCIINHLNPISCCIRWIRLIRSCFLFCVCLFCVLLSRFFYIRVTFIRFIFLLILFCFGFRIIFRCIIRLLCACLIRILFS